MNATGNEVEGYQDELRARVAPLQGAGPMKEVEFSERADSILGTPSTAYGELVVIAKSVLVEAGRRRMDELPGLAEHLQDNVIVVVGGTTRAAHGWFQCGSWHYNGRAVHEVFLNAAFSKSGDAAEGVLTTLCHEGVHAWNNLNGVADCSNRGRYHNRKFAEAALQFGLLVTKDPQFGHVTVGLQAAAQQEFADLLMQLRDALTIARRPRRISQVPGGTTERSGIAVVREDEQAGRSKYLFASCACRTARGAHVTFRMARGSWRDDVAIKCTACGSQFTPRVSTITGQSHEIATTPPPTPDGDDLS